MNLKVSMEDLYPLISRKLEADGEVTFIVSGVSMQPMIINGKDTVTLISPPKKLKKYDLPFFRLDDGRFVLHRIVKINNDGSYECRGDNRMHSEYNVRPDQIIGFATRFTHNNKEYSCKGFAYKLYAWYMVDFFFLRYFWRKKLRPFLARIKHKIFN